MSAQPCKLSELVNIPSTLKWSIPVNHYLQVKHVINGSMLFNKHVQQLLQLYRMGMAILEKQVMYVSKKAKVYTTLAVHFTKEGISALLYQL